jgi:hypothetical protein
MSVNDILYMALGSEIDNSIKYWSRQHYNSVALLMGLNPKDYKNKIEIFSAIGVELPHYLEKNPDIKEELRDKLMGNTNHYLSKSQ